MVSVKCKFLKFFLSQLVKVKTDYIAYKKYTFFNFSKMFQNPCVQFN